MPDFALLPPEVNSGLMYAGPGAGPLLAAAAGWDALAAELDSTAAGYSAVIAGLTGLVWLGPSSVAMAAAATPYVGWLSATGAAAVKTSGQAYAAAAAYEAAFAMTVPPPEIAANRAQLMMLVATNFFGQNTPAIAATEALYMEMWIQDATAMYGYAADSEAASALTAFDEPPQTTKQSGRDAQRRGRDGAQEGRGKGRGDSRWGKHCGPQGPSPTQIDPGSAYTAGPEGATVLVDEGTITVGPGSVVNAGQGTVTAATVSLLTFSDFQLSVQAGETVPYYGNFTVTSGSVIVPAGSTVNLAPGGSLTGGVQSGATVTVTSGTLTPAAVTPATPATPAAAAPAATTTTTTTSTTSTTSSASTTSSSSTSGTTTSGTTSGTTSAPAEQVPGAQPQSAPGAQPQSAPAAQPASGVPQAAPALASPNAVPGLASPLAAPAGPLPAIGAPAVPLGGPLEVAAGAPEVAGAAPNLALGEPGSLPFVHTDQVVLTSSATLLGAGGGGFTTFISTKATFYRGETVVTNLQHEALVRDSSLRFVKSLDIAASEISLSSSLELSTKLDELMSSNHAVRILFDQIQAGAAPATASQALEFLSNTTELAPPTLDRIATVTFGATHGTTPQLAQLNDIIMEMKLIMPSDVLQKAQYAAIVTLLAAHNGNHASSAAVTDFVDAVRSDFGLDPITLA